MTAPPPPPETHPPIPYRSFAPVPVVASPVIVPTFQTMTAPPPPTPLTRALPAGAFWKPALRRHPFFRGGKLVVVEDEEQSHGIAVLPGKGMVMVPSLDGIGGGDMPPPIPDILAFCYSSTSHTIVAANIKGLIQVFMMDKTTITPTKHFSSHHNLPITDMDIDPTSAFIATGSVDTTVRVFSLLGGYPTHNFSKGHKAVISLVRFHPAPNKLLLCSADISGVACIWDLHSNESLWLRNHMSTITSVCFWGKRFLATGARDRVVCVWSHTPENRKEPLLKTIPVLEAVEGLVVLPTSATKHDDNTCLFTVAGSNGVVRIFSFHNKTYEAMVILSSPHVGAPISSLGLLRDGQTLVVTSDLECQVVFLSVTKDSITEATARPCPILLGYDDDVTDVDFIHSSNPNTDTLVMGTNGDAVRVYTITNNNPSESRVQLLKGHTGPILAVAASSSTTNADDFFITGSKDQTARIWSVASLECLGVCTGHTDSVTSVAAGTTASRLCLTCGGEDGSVRAWFVGNTGIVPAGHRVAHPQAAIMDVCISHDDAFMGTASMDKSAKIWSLRKHGKSSLAMELMCELKGHRRVVHSIRLSHVDRVACTGSSDATIKVWSFKGECVRTLEGHGSPVTCALFLRQGTVLMSSAADGTIKTWDLKTSQCLQTNQHSSSDKVWALALSPFSDKIASVGTDGITVMWQDCTAEEQKLAFERTRKDLLEKQELEKAVREGKLAQAAMLALRMGHTFQLRLIMEKVVGNAEMQEFVNELLVGAQNRNEGISLLHAVSGWNTSARTYVVAQRVLRALLVKQHDVIGKVGVGAWNEFCEGVQPYTERHAKRVHVLERSSYLLDHVLFVAKGDEGGRLL